MQILVPMIYFSCAKEIGGREKKHLLDMQAHAGASLCKTRLRQMKKQTTTTTTKNVGSSTSCNAVQM